MTETVCASTDLTVDVLMTQSGVAFGTSGARGEVVAMTDRVCYGYTQGFLSYLHEIGEYANGPVALAGDLRPSSPRILAACAQAIRDMGGEVVFCGYVPTPALALYAFGAGIPCLMVTGSHIPDDRNGIKFYRPAGEVLKSDEAGMKRQSVTLAPEAFDAHGMLASPAPLPPVTDVETAYVARYVDAFGADALSGMTVGVYQHSAVGRDVVTRIVAALGAQAVPLGRSEKFIPVDTEAVRPEDITLAREWAAQHGFDAIVSTDGDSDRPLLADANGEWLRGDVLGVLCARAIGAGTVVTPVSSNTVLELSGAFAHCARTRIGSPFVIDAMNAALAAGQTGVCGYEANGGFLLASDFALKAGTISALPTRDAVLPAVAVMAAARAKGMGVGELLNELPPRVTYSDRIQNFATARSEAIFAALLEGDAAAQLARLDGYFGGIAGVVVGVDLTDGIRMTTAEGKVLHLRRSGNAPELRCYSEADDAQTAAAINAAALAVVLDKLAV
ncbi:phosphomannomutase [Novosphingobium sp. FSY-8]|uniref:Phosphomannomutase n=1 Tax=Novosphingobium ovatum TaxID=1908523 RepID=A0ABW9XCF8_9SPHN|nr:phosphomannomutase [Novosphingobium ovatum]NBC36198.1 phosphomannomutase [Novosphingobium ovatum]